MYSEVTLSKLSNPEDKKRHDRYYKQATYADKRLSTIKEKVHNIPVPEDSTVQLAAETAVDIAKTFAAGKHGEKAYAEKFGKSEAYHQIRKNGIC
jgi:hypothetical protein